MPPTVVLVRAWACSPAGDTWADANIARLVYIDAIKVMAGARRMGGAHYLPDDFRTFHRALGSGVLPPSREGSRRRGGEGGRQGGHGDRGGPGFRPGDRPGPGRPRAAHVVLADVNVAGARQAAAAPQPALGAGRAIGLAIDVTAAESVAEAVHQVVRTYGGLDLLVSNAGVLRAASVKTQAEKDFDLSTAVNYKGYFLCVQKRCARPGQQHEVRPDYRSDIIQINSKSGLEGSQQELRLCRQQVRRDRLDPVVRPGARDRRHQGELHMPGQLLRRAAVVRPRQRPVRAVPAHAGKCRGRPPSPT